MSARSRTIYNVEGLFVAPFSGDTSQPNLNNFKILRPIKNVQSIEYNITQESLAVSAFGSKSTVYQGSTKQTDVILTFQYVPDGLTNEKRLNFNAYNFSDQPNLSMKNVAFSGIDTLEHKDKKDFYVTINSKENDIYKKNINFDNTFYNPSSESSIIDQNSKEYGLLHFQNCYLNSYSFSIARNSLPQVTQSYSADNIIFYSSGSGVNYTTLDLRSGINEIKNEKLIIPKSVTGISGLQILLPSLTNITIGAEKQSDEVKFQSDFIAAFDFNLQFNRITQRQINYKFPVGRNIAYPIIGSLGLGLIVKENLTGSFFNSLNRNTKYNITVDFSKSKNDTFDTKMIFSGCRFSNIQYSNAINSFKIANLRFNFEQDMSPNLKGLFWSGNTEYGMISNAPVSW